MNLWIAFFRGINVGGHHIIPMRELKAMLVEIGCDDVSTYIQSGNVVFNHDDLRSDVLESKICRAVNSRFGFEPRVMLLTLEQLKAAVAANPFPAGESQPKSLHFFFLTADVGTVDWDAFDALKKDTEQFKLVDRVFYLHAPDGIGRSKLAANIEKLLEVPGTARNWRTVDRVLQLAGRQD